MILTCNSCNKKFVVPDSAITASGRMVQCGSCGNKWKQFPLGKDKNSNNLSTTKNSLETTAGSTKNTKTEKSKKNFSKKTKRN